MWPPRARRQSANRRPKPRAVSSLRPRRQCLAECRHRAAAMALPVLLLPRELREGAGVALRQEEWVVAEALRATRRLENSPGTLALHDQGRPLAINHRENAVK